MRVRPEAGAKAKSGDSNNITISSEPVKKTHTISSITTLVINRTTNAIGNHRSITKVKTFATRLLRARHARGLSQKALARATGLSQSAIASYENGTRKSAKGIFKLAEALQ